MRFPSAFGLLMKMFGQLTTLETLQVV